MENAVENCPACSAELGTYFINEDEAVMMCIKAECSYPFQHGDDIKLLPKTTAQKKINERSIAVKTLMSRYSTKEKMERKRKQKLVSSGSVGIKEVKDSDDCVCMDFDLEKILASDPYPQEEIEAIKLNDIIREIEQSHSFF